MGGECLPFYAKNFDFGFGVLRGLPVCCSVQKNFFKTKLGFGVLKGLALLLFCAKKFF
jgi:hypothetical protein